MIRNDPQPLLDLASAWIAGVAGLFLLIGAGGALSPTSPALHFSAGDRSAAEPSRVEEVFSAPPEPSAPSTPEDAEAVPAPPDIAIPPLPEITAPLQPPEMLEIQAIEPIPEQKPPARPHEKTLENPEPKPPSKRSSAPAGAAGRTQAGNPGEGQPLPFSTAGGGRFPAPAYPSSARSGRMEGTVVLLVHVEASGVPTAVEIRSSSGHTLLDTAARDHLRRNWRWPSGETRLYLVPIKFVLK
jgi:TonB family protein